MGFQRPWCSEGKSSPSWGPGCRVMEEKQGGIGLGEDLCGRNLV